MESESGIGEHHQPAPSSPLAISSRAEEAGGSSHQSVPHIHYVLNSTQPRAPGDGDALRSQASGAQSKVTGPAGTTIAAAILELLLHQEHTHANHVKTNTSGSSGSSSKTSGASLMKHSAPRSSRRGGSRAHRGRSRTLVPSASSGAAAQRGGATIQCRKGGLEP
jgi:hypothetical protein